MALDFKKTYGFDKNKAEEGIWIDLGDGTAIRVARLGTTRYQNILMRHTRKYQAQIRVNRLDADMMTDITANTLADCILLDWKNVVEDGQNIPYSRTSAYRMLKEYPDFRALVENYANDPDLFQDVNNLELDSKNSLTTSSGT